jgi:hypothetical protein
MAKRVIGGFVALGASLLLVTGGVATAAVATDSHASVRSALAILGVKASDDLVDTLASDGRMGLALAKGKDRAEIERDRSAKEEDDEAGTESESDSARSAQVSAWREAFFDARAELRIDFDRCRAGEADPQPEGPGKSECAHIYVQAMKEASIAALIMSLEDEIDALAAGPATAATIAMIADLQARLDRALAKEARILGTEAARGSSADHANKGKSDDAPGRAGGAGASNSKGQGAIHGQGKGLEKNAPEE